MRLRERHECNKPRVCVKLWFGIKRNIFPCISVCHCEVTQFEGTPGMACMHIVKDKQRGN